MKININCKTNHITDVPMINTLILSVNGKEITLDRDTAEYTFIDTTSEERLCNMTWLGAYRWTGEEKVIPVITRNDVIKFERLEVEDDIEQDNVYYLPTSIELIHIADGTDYKVM